jgi:hypothetical protein
MNLNTIKGNIICKGMIMKNSTTWQHESLDIFKNISGQNKIGMGTKGAALSKKIYKCPLYIFG